MPTDMPTDMPSGTSQVENGTEDISCDTDTYTYTAEINACNRAPVRSDYRPGEFCAYIKRFSVPRGSGEEITHTSLSKPAGAFFVPWTDLERFYDQYIDALENGEDLHVTEIHRDFSPVLIDIDLRFSLDSPQGSSPRDISPGTNDHPTTSDTSGQPSTTWTACHQNVFRRHSVPTIDAIMDVYAKNLVDLVEIRNVDDTDDDADDADDATDNGAADTTNDATNDANSECSETQSVTAYVLQRDAPRVDKAVLKDGLHIIIPGILTRPCIQYALRAAVLQELSQILCPPTMDTVNSIDDIVDYAVISRAPWMMHGSKKPMCEPYRLFAMYTIHGDGSTERVWTNNRYSSANDGVNNGVDDVSNTQTTLAKEHPPSDADLVRILSLRNKGYRETTLTDQGKKVVEDDAAEQRRMIDDQQDHTANANRTSRASTRGLRSAEQVLPGRLIENTCDNIELVRSLVQILSPTRADTYDSWIRVGITLRNIDHRLLDAWDEFSRQSDKYEVDACASHWSSFRMGPMGMGTLRMWAKSDSPDAYEEIVRVDRCELIAKSASGTHADVARVIHAMYVNEFVCSSVKHNTWYMFNNHRWNRIDSGVPLRQRISGEVSREYLRASSTFAARAANELDDNAQEHLTEMSKKLTSISIQLRNNSFKESVFKEVRELFYDAEFAEALDSNPMLLGCANGVFDFSLGTFREGTPSDHISLCTNVSYEPPDPDTEACRAIERYFEQVFTRQDLREYVLDVLGSFLLGQHKAEVFHIFIGSGSNSKSLTINLIESVLGDYACKLPVALLTQKRAASNAANSELARTKGRRFVSMLEPSDDDHLNVGLMKELTGNDKIVARGLYQDATEFRPQFSIVLCTNNLPSLSADDGGTWRRIRVVEFSSRFTADPDPTKPNEFKMDLTLSERMEAWKSQLLAMLIERGKSRMGSPIRPPECVMAATRAYQRNSDEALLFVTNYLEKIVPPPPSPTGDDADNDENGATCGGDGTEGYEPDVINNEDMVAESIPVSTAWDLYLHDFAKNNHIKNPRRKDVLPRLINLLGQPVVCTRSREVVFVGWRARETPLILA